MSAYSVVSSVYSGSTCIFACLFKKIRGVDTNYTPAEISSITYTIQDVSNGGSDVTGHTNVSLTVSDVMFTAETRTYNGVSGTYNFEWIPDDSTNEPFPEREHVYRVEITPVPSDGLCTPAVFLLKAE